MTRFAPQWLQAGSYAASVDRRLISALWPAARSAGGTVTPTGTGMAVQAAPGQVAVPAGNGTGSVLCTWDAPETVTLDPAPPSGTNRVDLIVVRVDSTDVGSSGADDFVVTVVAGAEAAAPTPPAVPANAVALAQIAVTGGAASIVAANITDRRPFGLAVGGGAPALPPPVTTGSAVQSFTAADGEVYVAKNGVFAGAWQRARDVMHANGRRTTAQSVQTAAVIIMNAIDYDPYGLYSQATGLATIPIRGVWRMDAGLALNATATGQWMQCIIYLNGAAIAWGMQHSAMAIWTAPNCAVTAPRNAGDTMGVYGGASLNLGLNVSGWACRFALSYLGSLP